MDWKGRWLITAALAAVMAGFGIWARGKLNGGETAPPKQGTGTGMRVAGEPPPAVPAAEMPGRATPPPPLADPLPGTDVSPSTTAPTVVSSPPAAEPVPAPASGGQVVPAGFPTPAPPPAPDAPSPTPAAVAPAAAPPAPAAAPPAAPPAPLTPVPPPAPAPVECPWTLRVQIIDGKTHLEARTDKEVHFRIVCDRLNLQAPDGAIEAHGTVKVTANHLDGLCDRLTISWLNDRIDLTGQVRVTCRREGQEVEMTGERLSLKLTATTQVRTGGRVVPTGFASPETTSRKPAQETSPRGAAGLARPDLEVDPPAAVDPFDGRPD
ncbi:MAG: hypothetical protein NZ700_11335 [Gemmataceae bacterium]|nr:hypothetical protein [Gemmataceae bacterium]MDW8265981.1 hypothetical protein [Gemmataceae bacterium]